MLATIPHNPEGEFPQRLRCQSPRIQPCAVHRPELAPRVGAIVSWTSSEICPTLISALDLLLSQLLFPHTRRKPKYCEANGPRFALSSFGTINESPPCQ